MDNEPELTGLWETEMRTALRRVDAPEGFAERVRLRVDMTQAISAQPKYSWHSVAEALRTWQTGRLWWRVALPLAALATLPVAAYRVEQIHVQAQKAAVAQAQFDRALQVTDRVLDHTAEQLRHGQVGAISRALNGQSERSQEEQ